VGVILWGLVAELLHHDDIETLDEAWALKKICGHPHCVPAVSGKFFCRHLDLVLAFDPDEKRLQDSTFRRVLCEFPDEKRVVVLSHPLILPCTFGCRQYY
jgi:hypothetical protein